MSTIFRDSKTGALLGGHLFCSWGRDDAYEVIEDASLAEWHNTAAEIAMEVKPERPQVLNVDVLYMTEKGIPPLNFAL